MNYYDEYRNKLRTTDEAVQVVKSGDWVDYTVALGFPPLLDAALARRRDELRDVKIRGNLIFGPIQAAECDPLREHFIYNSWHCSAYERRLADRGLCNYIPMVFHNVVPYYQHFLKVNVAMLAVTPMDRHGYFNLSCNTGTSLGIAQQADIVIVEINEKLRNQNTELVDIRCYIEYYLLKVRNDHFLQWSLSPRSGMLLHRYHNQYTGHV